MSFTNMVLIGVALFAILGAVGAFTIAFRRSQAAKPSPTAGVSTETRRSLISSVLIRCLLSSLSGVSRSWEGYAGLSPASPR